MKFLTGPLVNMNPEAEVEAPAVRTMNLSQGIGEAKVEVEANVLIQRIRSGCGFSQQYLCAKQYQTSERNFCNLHASQFRITKVLEVRTSMKIYHAVRSLRTKICYVQLVWG